MSVRIVIGDCRAKLAEMPAGSVQTCVTSPPYFGLRDYGMGGQIGLEATPDAFVAEMVGVFREVRRVLRDDGTLWLNLGDSYATGAGKASSPGGGKQGERFVDAGPSGYRGTRGPSGKHTMPQTPDGKNPHSMIPTFQPNRMPLPGLKPKDLIGIPWRVAFALQADGWYLRQDIIWHKPNPMPESVTDRCTKAHEYLFLLSKSARYHFDAEAISEAVAAVGPTKDTKSSGDYSDASGRNDGGGHRSGGFPHAEQRNRRSVWEVVTQPFSGAHFATFPPALIEPCILAGCPKGGLVLDPFGGAGTTGLVADRLGRDAVLIELNPAYADIAERRLHADAGLFASIEVAA